MIEEAVNAIPGGLVEGDPTPPSPTSSPRTENAKDSSVHVDPPLYEEA